MDVVPRRVHSVRSLRFPDHLASALDEFVEAMWPFGVFDDALLGGGTAENLASCGRDVLLRLARYVDSAHKGEGVCR